MIPSIADDQKKPKKLSSADKRAIVVEARERIQDSWDHDKDNRRDAASDLRFLAGDQWPYDVRRARDAAGRHRGAGAVCTAVERTWLQKR